MDDNQGSRRLVERLHAAPFKAVLYVTGGGSQGISTLLGVAGASRTILEVSIPYAAQSLTALLGARPGKAVSLETARTLALLAFDRAVELGAEGREAVGLGLSAALATGRERKGEHRIVAAAQSAECSLCVDVRLAKGSRSRQEEETIAGRALLRALAGAFRVREQVDLGIGPADRLDEETRSQDDLLIRLFVKETPPILMTREETVLLNEFSFGFLVPGAFNPAHEGHEGLVRTGERLIGKPGAFELSLRNMDKPTLSPGEARRRAQRLVSTAPVVFTMAGAFTEKARLFPGVCFVVGVDTAARILDPSYCKPGETMDGALAFFQQAGTRFLVAGRLGPGGFRTLDDLEIPPGRETLFEKIPESLFRLDVSSTELRTRLG